MAMSILSDLIRINLQSLIIGPLANALGGGTGGNQAGQAAQLAAAGTALTTAGGTLTAASPGLATAGATMETAALSLSSAATAWAAVAAEIMAAANALGAAGAAGGGGFGSMSGGLALLLGGAGGGVGDLGALTALGSAGSADAVASGVLFGFAGGGGFNIAGRPGIDNNVMSINGLPIAKVSYGERVSISNDNQAMSRGGGGFGGDMHFHFPAGVSRREARETGLQAANAFRGAVARSSKVNN
jgi:hypothetical protein